MYNIYNNIYRVAKHEANVKTRFDKNPIVSLDMLSTSRECNGIIKKIGHRPFYVYYWSNTQIHVYRRYCNKNYSR